jgi:hypothetical protein
MLLALVEERLPRFLLTARAATEGDSAGVPGVTEAAEIH